MKFRFFVLVGGTILSFLFVIFNIYNLQIEQGDYYARKAQAQSGFLSASRGKIYFTDKNNSLIQVALEKDFPLIYAAPRDIVDPAEASQLVASKLGLNAGELLVLFSKKQSQYVKLIAKATPEQIAAVNDIGIKGVYVDEDKARSYPLATLAAHLIGFVGQAQDSDTVSGKYGIERYYEETLSGKDGSFSDGKVVDPQSGGDIMLTIDRTIQSRAAEILAGLVEKYHPVGGTIIVQEPATGKILAMESYPTFDPNDYGKYPVGNFLNPATQAVYEPGSIFKVITMSAGIDSGAITPQTTYYDSGELNLNGKTIKNWDGKAHGTLTMTNVIEQSINTGAAFAERKTGDKTFYDYLVKFGFKEPTYIDLPGETVGKLTPLEKNKQAINFATASFGQGVSVTPIRLITAISAIANHGVLNQAFVTEAHRSNIESRVMSSESAHEVAAMMVSAVDKAKIAAVPGYEVAGKSGTAQIPDFVHGGYLDFTHVVHSYAGFAPAYNPRFTVLIKLEKPEGGGLAGQTVVPAFHELVEFLLNYYNVPPTRADGGTQ
jgi:cell division protein FtsI/penicillin-binding protein 2